MSFKKILAVAAVTGLVTAMALPALALENEFHGLFRVFGFVTNAETGGGTFNLAKDAKTSSFVEQRARIMYIAKASDDLKLVTHFELDSRWGGQDTSGAAAAANKYPIGDGGGLDADRISLETKNIYLDFKIPSTPISAKAGIQPFTDAYKGVFGAFDGAGLVTSAKLDAFTPTLGWFRFTDNNFNTAVGAVGKQTLDMAVVDGKFALSKDLTIGGSYYSVHDDQGLTTSAAAISRTGVNYKTLQMVGLNVSANLEPAVVDAFFAYQFGDMPAATKLSAFMGGATAKVKVGPGNINAAVLYLSGDDGVAGGTRHDAQLLAASGSVSYFNPSNMWLLIRNGATINSSTAINGTDLTHGGRGLLGGFAGYDGTVDKFFFSGNGGYAMVNEKRTASSDSIGIEVNATVGYKLYDNLAASLTGAYLILGDYEKKIPLGASGVNDADNPYLAALQLNYTF